jgi:hypothetical protein
MKEVMERASKKFNEFGPLGVTSQDHKDLGSTPPDILKENPGKTKADVYSNEELEQVLQAWIDDRDKYTKPQYIDNTFTQSYLKVLRKKILLSIKYLRSIDRLPEKFKIFDKIVK